MSVSINFQRRFDPLYLEASEHSRALRRGGGLRSLRLEARDPYAYGDDTVRRVLYNSIVHELDTAAWILGPLSHVTLRSLSKSRAAANPRSSFTDDHIETFNLCVHAYLPERSDPVEVATKNVMMYENNYDHNF